MVRVSLNASVFLVKLFFINVKYIYLQVIFVCCSTLSSPTILYKRSRSAFLGSSYCIMSTAERYQVIVFDATDFSSA